MPTGEELLFIAFFFACIYSAVYFGVLRRRPESDGASARAKALAPEPEPEPEPGEPDIMSVDLWMNRLNNQPDTWPHTLITGPTGSGKTTFVIALLSGRRQKRALVITPKLNAGNWRGAQVASLTDTGDYDDIKAALDWVDEEKRRRAVALRQGQQLEELTVILDETPEICAHLRTAGMLVQSLASLGREIKLRLILISTSTRVNALGIAGRGDSVSNFAHVTLDHRRRAYWQGAELHTWQVLTLAQKSRLLPAGMPVGMPEDHTAGMPDTDGEYQQQTSVDLSDIPQDRQELLAFLVSKGWGTNQITRLVKGDRNQLAAEIRALKAGLQLEATDGKN